MRTDALIHALSIDARGGSHLGLSRRLLGAVTAAAFLSLAMLLATAGLRADLAAGLVTGPVVFKVVCGLAVSTGAFLLSRRLADPARDPRAAIYFAPAVFLLAGGLLIEALSDPTGLREAARWNTDSAGCLTTITVLALPPLAAVFAVLRNGAPRRPSGAGAIAGLLAGSIAATIYALYCPIDEAVFVVVWYGLAVTLLAAFGALIGRHLLAW